MKHEIPRHVNNSTLEYLIDERVRPYEDREILRDHWFRKKSFYKIAENRKCSLTHVKDIIYGFGDPLLVEAAEMDSTENS